MVGELVNESAAVIRNKKCAGYVGRFKDAGSVTTTDHLVTATKVFARVNDFFLANWGDFQEQPLFSGVYGNNQDGGRSLMPAVVKLHWASLVL